MLSNKVAHLPKLLIKEIQSVTAFYLVKHFVTIQSCGSRYVGFVLTYLKLALYNFYLIFIK